LASIGAMVFFAVVYFWYTQVCVIFWLLVISITKFALTVVFLIDTIIDWIHTCLILSLYLVIIALF